MFVSALATGPWRPGMGVPLSVRVRYSVIEMLRVECYASHRGEETPRVLYIDERKVFVEDVLDAWLGADHRYFKVKGDDGDVYIIGQDTTSGAWELTLFRRGS